MILSIFLNPTRTVSSYKSSNIKGLIHLIISLLFEKLENRQLTDTELIKMINVSPQNKSDNKETNLKMLDRIRDFISE